MNQELHDLAMRMQQFAAERDWDQYHSPKNLSMALAVEASELMEHFQWLTEEQSRKLSSTSRDAVKEEMADILLYLVRLADQLEVDLHQAAVDKIAVNAEKYPADQVRGSAKKYTEYHSK